MAESALMKVYFAHPMRMYNTLEEAKVVRRYIMNSLMNIGAILCFGLFLLGCFFLAIPIFWYEALTGKDVKWFDELAGPGY